MSTKQRGHAPSGAESGIGVRHRGHWRVVVLDTSNSQESSGRSDTAARRDSWRTPSVSLESCNRVCRVLLRARNSGEFHYGYNLLVARKGLTQVSEFGVDLLGARDRLRDFLPQDRGELLFEPIQGDSRRPFGHA